KPAGTTTSSYNSSTSDDAIALPPSQPIRQGNSTRTTRRPGDWRRLSKRRRGGMGGRARARLTPFQPARGTAGLSGDEEERQRDPPRARAGGAWAPLPAAPLGAGGGAGGGGARGGAGRPGGAGARAGAAALRVSRAGPRGAGAFGRCGTTRRGARRLRLGRES